MATRLGRVLAAARRKRGLSLRDVERETGIRNAHLSQVETGVIERPDPNILWLLAQLYQLDFGRLMRLAGHVQPDDSRKQRLLGFAFRALGDLTPREQEEVLRYIDTLRSKRKDRH